MYHIARQVTRRLTLYAAMTGAVLVHPFDSLTLAIARERTRLFFWLPVLFGVGISVYFALPVEPSRLIVAVIGLLSVFGAWQLRHTGLSFWALGLAMVALGLVAATVRTEIVSTPVLPAEIGPAELMGTVTRREVREKDTRLTVRLDGFAGLRAEDLPGHVRLTVRTAGDDAQSGDRIMVRATLLPPSPPVEPGAFDFQRYAFYRGIGANGYAMGPVIITATASATAQPIAQIRDGLTARIRAALDNAAGGVAVALLVGERGGIPASDTAALRDAGLAHLLAISGLHMGLVSGFLFWLIRLGLALRPAIALHFPIKKIAAVAALTGALAYLLLTGGSVPTIRAFVMVGLVMLAVLTDRRAISLRTVALAALVVLAMTPETLLEPGFQMSFAAVVALVAVYERFGDRMLRRTHDTSLPMRMLIYLAGVCVTTLVAGLATAPFAIYHFGRVADYGVLANLAAVPVMAFWVMPAGTLSILAMPLGLELLPLWFMGQGIDLILIIAHAVAGLDGAVRLVPAMPAAGLVAVTLGGLWLCLWSGSWRLFGWLPICIGMVTPYLIDPPLLRITGDGRLTGITTAAGGMLLSSERREKFVASQWLARVGQTDPAGRWPHAGASADGSLRCDLLGCILRRDGWMIALPTDARAVDEDCGRADVVVATVPVNGRCPSARVVVDVFDLWRDGPHVLYLGPDQGPQVRTVNGSRGDRPWVWRPIPRKDWYWGRN
ncbi:MAG: ComEC/Rec2 family competence protein [Minwuia sp.]|nr:ComEC/Rec2 family competence protein [Minwuia sp.]